MPIIDFHNHYYPPGYIKALRAGESSIEVTIDDHAIDMQVYTMTTPGTHVETPAVAARLAALVNDEFAEGIAAHPGRFSALATLPLNDPAASVKELDRAVRQLHLPGAMLFSNVNGVALADPRFLPLYELANDLGAVLYIHPTHPLGVV